ncbi:septum site-determining protein MinC [Phytophthora cinnamomi]|uniref:septum site-determining protein MinC n=1 Tax=Phytophthora cinnamomi TaxID=4785 RepID=UPI003559CFFC|nr:septum site-determining protein MinC [Phytophthora cinnamomi]
MQQAVLTTRRRAFSQQALRRWEDVASGNGRRASTAKALELDGRSYLLPTLTLARASGSREAKDAKDSQLFQARANKPTPVVLDLQQVSSDGSPHSQSIKKHELRNEILQLQDAGYMPVGITNASEDVKKAAAALNLPYFIGTRLHLEQQKAGVAAAEEQAEDEMLPAAASNATSFAEEEKAGQTLSAQTAAEPLPPMVVTHSVRSGQQIFAQNRSLVVLGNVSSGAEVMADEDVLVLGVLKGRALAGIGGNEETGALQLHKPTVISLQDDRLHFESSTV